ncbi:MAG: major coat protein [Oscillospiraceae bacterium]
MYKNTHNWVKAQAKKAANQAAALGTTVTLVATQAKAALPDGAEEAFTTLETDIGSAAGLVIPIVLVVVGIAIMISVFKKH